jgi:hypothetical protein
MRATRAVCRPLRRSSSRRRTSAPAAYQGVAWIDRSGGTVSHAVTATCEILTFTNLDPATSCADTTIRYTITLASGAGTLVLIETGVVCFLGKSTLAPGAMKSFARPAGVGDIESIAEDGF